VTDIGIMRQRGKEADATTETSDESSLAAVPRPRVCSDGESVLAQSKVTSVQRYLWNVLHFAKVALQLALG